MFLCPQDTRGQPQAWFRESGYVYTLSKDCPSFSSLMMDLICYLIDTVAQNLRTALESPFSPSTVTQTITWWRVIHGRILRSQFMSMFSWFHHILCLRGGNSNVSKLLKLCKYYPWKFLKKKKRMKKCVTFKNWLMFT